MALINMDQEVLQLLDLDLNLFVSTKYIHLKALIRECTSEKRFK